jgi:hypothetical protein
VLHGYARGAIWGGLVAPVLTYLTVQMNFGFAMPMMIGTMLLLVLVVTSVLFGPETKGKTLTADLVRRDLLSVPGPISSSVGGPMPKRRA